MSEDIVERLRCHMVDLDHDEREQAAAEIERLRWRVMTLESAAKCAEGRRVKTSAEKTDGIGNVTPVAFHENDEKRAVCDMKGPLTDEERASFVRAIETLEGVEYLEAFSTENDKTAATLRGLLDRMK